ncbi:hypothetical protein R9X50_00001500 [Acrodontium crateriforme]|uniref:GPI transamidase subunit PIG-U n=1 Tax=Acrodontium crateriforme TaxID=150365 RepID=A0AAQ3LWI3_9PEZI|nr:hypothetical protein R9X50_00001500 [Acrodontium crateriforme]
MPASTRASVYHEHPKAVLLGAAATLRILLALVFPQLPALLTGRVEISTPVNSFKRLQEGLYLYEKGLDPYNGGVFHQAPLLLPLFSLLPSSATWLGSLTSIILYTALDLITANCIFRIAQSGAALISRTFTSPRQDRAWSAASITAIYLFNPFTVLACLGRPTTVFTTAFTALSLSHACQGNTITATFAIAIASYISLHPLLLLPAIGILCYDQVCQRESLATESSNVSTRSSKVIAGVKVAVDQRTQPKPVIFAAQISATFALALAVLLLLSRALLPSWQFIPSVYATPLTLPDLTPNPGVWWYFFIEMFDAFRSFFLGVFWLHMLAYSVPFCLRLGRQPLAAAVLMMGVIAVFEPYANIGDVGFWLSCLCLLGHVFELSSIHRYTFPALAAILYGTLLGPAFHHLWIYAGSGNANFFYAITLVWSLGLLILLTDTLYSVLRDEWENDRPEGKGKEIRQI